MFAQLLRARLRKRHHVGLRPELQASGRTRLDARRLQPLADAVRAQRALVDLLRQRVELRDVERASARAVLTADAVLLLEVDDAVRVLDDRAVGRARAQAARILAVHALILAHQPLQHAVLALVLVELDQVPEIPLRFRHRLIGVVEGRRLEWIAVPFDARDFARLAADAGGDVDVLADLLFAGHPGAGDAP